VFRPLLAVSAAVLLVATAGCSTSVSIDKDKPVPNGLTVGGFSLATPAGWTVRKDEDEADSFHLVVSGTCTDDGAAQLSGCKSIAVLGPSYVKPDEDDGPPLQPYDPAETHSGQYVQDEGYACPADTKLRAGTAQRGAKLVRKGTEPVGGKQAVYREWTVTCFTKDPESGEPLKKTATAYTERDWYLADAKVLIVDEWDTPNLAGLLAKATWS
jgi:hypothetical protein